MQSVHLTHCNQQPSVLQWIAQQKLNDLLSPALRSLITIYAHQFPRSGLRLLNYRDELYTLLMLFIQRHYLRIHQSSISESFYGVKRRRSEILNRSFELSSSDRNWSLFSLVIVPYLKIKLDHIHHDLYSNQGAGFLVPEETDSSQQSIQVQMDGQWKRRLERFILHIYPYIHASYVGSQVLYLLLHLVRQSSYFSPLLHWMKLHIVAVTPIDLLNIQRKSQVSQSSHFLSRSIDLVKAVIPYSIFGYTFVEWYLTTDYVKLGSPKRVFPPPPPHLSPHPNGLALPSSRLICPLCKCKINNPTAVPTGYVFCYVCIFNFITLHSHCPVTLKPVQASQIRRIFQSDL